MFLYGNGVNDAVKNRCHGILGDFTAEFAEIAERKQNLCVLSELCG